MSKRKICRSCKMNQNMVVEPAKHHLVSPGIHCPLCNHHLGKFYSHIDDDLWGDALECKKCHNYILYLSPYGEKWKEESYLPNDTCVIRHFENNETYISVKNKDAAKVKHLITFNSLDDLMKKVRTIITFS